MLGSFSRECDGFVSVSTSSFAPECIDAMRTWLAETNRSLYTVGPLVPPSFSDTAGLSTVAKQMEFDSSQNGNEFNIFLDRILKSHGKYSLIYVRYKYLYPWLVTFLNFFNFNFRFHLELCGGLREMDMYCCW